MKIGKKISGYISPGDILCLTGQLGAGKTVLVKGIAKGLGIKNKTITSPSFVIIRQYAGRIPLYHFDLYRLGSPGDIFSLGYEEYLYGLGVSVIEWADRLDYLTPGQCLKIQLSIQSPGRRLLSFSARGKRYKELLGKINENFKH